MKSNHLLKAAALAAFVATGVASYAAGLGGVDGDLILGFQDSTKSVEFKFGTPNLTAYDGSTSLLGNVNTALSWTGAGGTGYGSSWSSNSGIVWGVAVNSGSTFTTGMRQTADTPLATLSGGAATVNSTLNPAGDTTAAQFSLGSLLTGMNTIPSGGQLKAGGTSILAATYVNTSNSSWAKVDLNTAGVAFGTFGNGTLLNSAVTATTTGTAGVLSGKTYSALDLYQFSGPAGSVTNTFLGTLALTTGGDVYFTSALAAIPEPSTYAALLGIATLGFAAIRRRKQALLEA